MMKSSALEQKSQILSISPRNILIKIVLELNQKNVRILRLFLPNRNRMMGLCMWTAPECTHVVLETDSLDCRTLK